MGLFEMIVNSIDSMSIILAGIALLISLSWFRLRSKAPRKPLPPGLISWPIVGNIPHFILCKKEAPEAFWDISKRLGPVIYVSFGASRAVVLNDYQSIKEAMNHPDLQDRPSQEGLESEELRKLVGGRSEGISMVSGKPWRDQRKFLLNTFRRFGVGKSRFEDVISMEAEAMMTVIRERENSAFDPQIMLSNALSNIICAVTFGQRFEYNDPKFESLLSLILRQFELIGNAAILAAFPILSKIGFGPIKEIRENGIKFVKFFQGVIRDHHKLDENDITDIIDAYRAEIRSAEDTGSPDQGVFNERNLGAVVADLFFAGVDSTVASLRWALAYLILNPDIQTKLQKELDDVIGRDRMPRWEDRTRLPYVEATIAEVQRIGTVAAIGGTHAARKDVELFGYTIPKGVAVIPNVYAVMRSPHLWEDPLQFRPERFLDGEGEFTKPEHFIPFNVGPRQCPGEQLARMELFVFLTHLLHKFTFSKPEDSAAPSTEGKMGINFKPPPFEVLTEERDRAT